MGLSGSNNLRRDTTIGFSAVSESMTLTEAVDDIWLANIESSDIEGTSPIKLPTREVDNKFSSEEVLNV